MFINVKKLYQFHEVEPKIILASSSPRRKQLLEDLNLKFEIAPCPCDEPQIPASQNLSPAAWAETLAFFKARSVAEQYPNHIVIGADTIVTHSNRIIGKPIDENHARQILTSMFAGRNDVITGLAVICLAQNKQIITHDVSTIIMRPMNPDEVEDYLRSGAWKGKAGAYALQEGGDRFVQSIQGSHTNIVGLPTETLIPILNQFK